MIIAHNNVNPIAADKNCYDTLQFFWLFYISNELYVYFSDVQYKMKYRADQGKESLWVESLHKYVYVMLRLVRGKSSFHNSVKAHG